MEERLARILFEALTMAFCLVVAMWWRERFHRWVNYRMLRERRRTSDQRRSWRFRNAWLLAAGSLYPYVCLIGPIREELIFRALLIAAFDRFDPLALIAIALSSFVFGRGHYKDPLAKEAIVADAGRIKASHLFLARFGFASGLGIVLSCIGIWSGSLWLLVAIHVAWNSFIFGLSYLHLALLKRFGRVRTHRRLAILMRRAVANKAMLYV